MKKRKLNLFQKFVFSFISVGLLPIIIIGYYSSTVFTRKIENIITDNYRQVAIYGVKNLDNAIDSYNAITKMLYTYNNQESQNAVRSYDSQGLARILKETDGSEASNLRKRLDLASFTRLIISLDKYIMNAVFVEEDGEYYYASRKNNSLASGDQFLNIVGHKSNVKRKGDLIITPTHEDRYFLYKKNKVFTLGRNYYDLSEPIGHEKIMGTLYMDIDIKMIDNIFKKLSVYDEGEIFVINKNRECIYSNKPEYVMTYLNELNNDHLVDIIEDSQKSDWQVVIRVDYSKVMDNINMITKVLYGIVFACVIGLCVLAVIYSKIFLKPINLLLKDMKKIESGNLDVEVDVNSTDEMAQLSTGFNNMIKELKKYIETSYLAQIKSKEAELNALKTQIQPHFLYNSLEIIRMNSVSNGDKETAQMSYLLAKQFRYLIGEVNETVTLKQELEMVEDYFKFVNVRNDHKISFINSVPKVYLDGSVLKLSIQPIVENCVVHGIKPRGFGQVMILAEHKDKDLLITILDNGIGMEQTTIQGIEERLSTDGMDYKYEESELSIGLKNVHDRLRYKYGPGYGLSIKSQPQIGTSITILQPLLIHNIKREEDI